MAAARHLKFLKYEKYEILHRYRQIFFSGNTSVPHGIRWQSSRHQI